jgi:hypothetical protein
MTDIDKKVDLMLEMVFLNNNNGASAPLLLLRSI